MHTLAPPQRGVTGPQDQGGVTAVPGGRIGPLVGRSTRARGTWSTGRSLLPPRPSFWCPEGGARRRGGGLMAAAPPFLVRVLGVDHGPSPRGSHCGRLRGSLGGLFGMFKSGGYLNFQDCLITYKPVQRAYTCARWMRARCRPADACVRYLSRALELSKLILT